MNLLQLAISLPNADRLLMAAGPPVVATVILLALQVLVIRKIADRRRRSLLIYATSAIQGAAMTLYVLAWALATFSL